MLAPFFCHWYVGEGVPLAAAVKVTEAPTVAIWVTGWVVMAGGVVAAVIVRTAPALVTEPALLLTIHV